MIPRPDVNSLGVDVLRRSIRQQLRAGDSNATTPRCVKHSKTTRRTTVDELHRRAL
jgi:hypothetical protein